ncbi:MAG: histidinol-phosphatase HisJ family protein [Oscillospiraceae bacterium]|nr:histidinol-phosphatase HisJ family protein [Oscillospiraceae bacterium]
MKLFDCHVHSSLSFDSKEPMENYVRKAVADGDEYFITTEHADLESYIFQGEDILADIEKQRQIVAQLNEKYPVNVLLGIEVGWKKSIHQRNMDIVKKYPFDMVILSIHETEEYDVATPRFREGRTADDCYHEYLTMALEAIDAFDDFDTFAHIDYVLRYVGHTDLSKHRQQLTEVFTKLIEKGKALEINTKTFPDPDAVERMEYIVSLYTSLGGKKITLGSDAHTASRHKNGFDKVIAALKANGVDSVCVFVGRKEHTVCI